MKNKGQTLIEAIVALSIIVTVMAAAYSLMSAYALSSRLAKEKMQAGAYLQDGLEKVRNIRDTNLKLNPNFDQDIDSSPGVSLIIKNQDGDLKDRFKVVVGGPEKQDIFTRIIKITKPDDNTLQVDIKVTWSDNARSIQAREILTNWKQQP